MSVKGLSEWDEFLTSRGVQRIIVLITSQESYVYYIHAKYANLDT